MPSVVMRRLVRSAGVVLFATLAGFALLRLVPGDAVAASIDGAGRSASQREALARTLGAGDPLPVQLARYLADVARLRLGTSTSEGRPVTTVIAEALPATVLLSATALLLAAVSGVTIGTLHGWRPSHRGARGLASFFLASYAVPEVILGAALLTLFSLRTALFPAGGLDDPLVALTGGALARWRDRVWHLALPAAALTMAWTALILRQQRNAVRAMAMAPHVRTARANGVPRWRLVWRHVLRPSLAATAATIGTMLPVLVGGTVVVESVFAWPGMGTLLVHAVAVRDAPLVAGIIVLESTAIVIASLGTEWLVLMLDPRVRSAAESPAT